MATWSPSRTISAAWARLVRLSPPGRRRVEGGSSTVSGVVERGSMSAGARPDVGKHRHDLGGDPFDLVRVVVPGDQGDVPNAAPDVLGQLLDALLGRSANRAVRRGLAPRGHV